MPVTAEQQQSRHWLALLVLQLPVIVGAHMFIDSFLTELVTVQNSHHIRHCIQIELRTSSRSTRFLSDVHMQRRRMFITQACQTYHAFSDCYSCLLFGCCLCMTQCLLIRIQAGRGLSGQQQPKTVWCTISATCTACAHSVAAS